MKRPRQEGPRRGTTRGTTRAWPTGCRSTPRSISCRTSATDRWRRTRTNPATLADRPIETLEEELRHPGSVVRDRQADMDTFDRRFPDALLKQQRSLAPSAWTSGEVGSQNDAAGAHPRPGGSLTTIVRRIAGTRSDRLVLFILSALLIAVAALRRDFLGDGIRHLPSILASRPFFGEPRWLLFPPLAWTWVRALSGAGIVTGAESAIQALLWMCVASGVAFLFGIRSWLLAGRNRRSAPCGGVAACRQLCAGSHAVLRRC